MEVCLLFNLLVSTHHHLFLLEEKTRRGLLLSEWKGCWAARVAANRGPALGRPRSVCWLQLLLWEPSSPEEETCSGCSVAAPARSLLCRELLFVQGARAVAKKPKLNLQRKLISKYEMAPLVDLAGK